MSLKTNCRDYVKDLSKTTGIPPEGINALLIYVMGNVCRAMESGCDVDIRELGHIRFDKKRHIQYLNACKAGMERDRKKLKR